MARTSAVFFPAALAVLTVLTALTRPAVGMAAAPAAYADTSCRTQVQDSLGVAVCHNPDPSLDHVRLHIECRRWWDPDVDGGPVAVGPAETVTLADRCWKEIQRIWVTITRGGR